MKKNILVTGSNKGIGWEIARQCAALGHRVFLTGRDGNRLREAQDRLAAQSLKADVLLMDVADPASIAHAVKIFTQFKLHLDVLVNNAGIAVKNDKKLGRDDEKILLETLETNSLGPLRVCKAFLPLLTSPSRIIMISSGLGVLNGATTGYTPAYSVSKTLLNSITKQIAVEWKDKDISVNAVCPGWVRTDMGGQNAERSVEKGAETPVWLALEAKSSLTGMFFRDKKPIDW